MAAISGARQSHPGLRRDELRRVFSKTISPPPASITSWPAPQVVGRNFRMHINSALVVFSTFRDQDVLRKTAIFYNDKYAALDRAVPRLDRWRESGDAAAGSHAGVFRQP